MASSRVQDERHHECGRRSNSGATVGLRAPGMAPWMRQEWKCEPWAKEQVWVSAVHERSGRPKGQEGSLSENVGWKLPDVLGDSDWPSRGKKGLDGALGFDLLFRGLRWQYVWQSHLHLAWTISWCTFHTSGVTGWNSTASQVQQTVTIRCFWVCEMNGQDSEPPWTWWH